MLPCDRKRVVDVSIHTMTDASQLAYAAVSYVRYEYEDGEITVRFVAAKAKVAPTKATSIPRLELMAAVLGLRLSRKVYWRYLLRTVHCGQTARRSFAGFRVSLGGTRHLLRTGFQRSIRSLTPDSGATSRLT